MQGRRTLAPEASAVTLSMRAKYIIAHQIYRPLYRDLKDIGIAFSHQKSGNNLNLIAW